MDTAYTAFLMALEPSTANANEMVASDVGVARVAATERIDREAVWKIHWSWFRACMRRSVPVRKSGPGELNGDHPARSPR